MTLRFVLFSTACLCFVLAPVRGANLVAVSSGNRGFVLSGAAGASFGSGGAGGEAVFTINKPGTIVEAKPIQTIHQVVLPHKPVTLVPMASIPSYSLMDKVSRLWGGISDSISTKINAVGSFFHPPPRVVVIQAPTEKPTTTKKPPIVLEVVAGVNLPQRVYHVPVAMAEDC